jgi:hypothetical protein
MEWHIDAWDPRGGRAFATQRTRNSDLGQPDEEVWGPTVYIGPPSFRPEQIANLGMALSARRSGAFDPRVPVDADTDEVSFLTADAVAEFVRRAFVSASRGRGGDGGGAFGVENGPEGPPPSEGGEPSPIEPYLADWSDAAEKLRKDQDLPGFAMGEAIRQRFDAQLAKYPPGQMGPVQSGALQVLACVLDGLPLYALHTPLFTQWQEAAATLDAALTELGLWSTWFTTAPAYRHVISSYLLARGQKELKASVQADMDGIGFAQSLLRWQPTTADPQLAAQRFAAALHFWMGYADDKRLQMPAQFADRYQALFTWPLPRYIQTQPACRSVGDLLVAFVSTPSVLVKQPARAMDIVLFAASLLASRTVSRTEEGWRERAAIHWLARSLPRYIFPEDTEALILDPEKRQMMSGVGM